MQKKDQISEDLYSIQESLRYYRVPTLIIMLGIILSVAAFHIALRSNIALLKREFYAYCNLQHQALEKMFLLLQKTESLVWPYTFSLNHSTSEVIVEQAMRETFKEEVIEAFLYVSAPAAQAERKEYALKYLWTTNRQMFWPAVISAEQNPQLFMQLAQIFEKKSKSIVSFPVESASGEKEDFIALASYRTDGKREIIAIQVLSLRKLVSGLFQKRPELLNDIYIYSLRDGKKQVWLNLPLSRAWTQQIDHLPENGQIDSIADHYPFFYFKSVEVNNTRLYMFLSPSTAYIISSSQAMPWIVLSLGILLTITIGALLLYYATRKVDIERLVDEKTAALRELTDELMSSNEELEKFAYVASHDLKAPLRAIDNISSWLEEDLGSALQGENKQNMALLRKRVHRMEGLLDDLLAYSQIGRKSNQKVEMLSGAQLLRETLLLLAPPKGFTIKISESLEKIMVPRMPLQQIFHNLIGNAIKHHDRKVGTIQVKVEEFSHFYRFSVEDDGPGIPAEYHQRIFEMFQTLKPRDQVEGSGMGLAMVKKILEKHNGSIKVESYVRGCSFIFIWPKLAA